MGKGLLGTVIFGLIFATVGYFVAFHFGKPILDDAKASTDWPNVEGVVERSEVTTSKNSDKKTMYSADVGYAYSVAGKDFQGSTVSFGGNYSSSSSSHAHAVTRRYAVGQRVPVYYEPENPAKSVLEPGTTWKSYMVFGIGLLFLFVGALMFAGPLGYLAVAAVVVAGAASGAIGRRKRTTDFDQPARPDPPAPSGGSTVVPKAEGDDDGFDIG